MKAGDHIGTAEPSAMVDRDMILAIAVVVDGDDAEAPETGGRSATASTLTQTRWLPRPSQSWSRSRAMRSSSVGIGVRVLMQGRFLITLHGQFSDQKRTSPGSICLRERARHRWRPNAIRFLQCEEAITSFWSNRHWAGLDLIAIITVIITLIQWLE